MQIGSGVRECVATCDGNSCATKGRSSGKQDTVGDLSVMATQHLRQRHMLYVDELLSCTSGCLMVLNAQHGGLSASNRE